MLYETAARAEEILGLNIEDLDFAGRRAQVKAKGARSRVRRRGQAREDFVHSALTHLGEAGASLLMPMAKSRHRKPENLRRYFKPSPDAIAELTSLLAPGDTRRGGGT
ncbi:hypothetical protein [Microtetraspora malaysiensis]|uniref:hypothetical protein n=1 Tax=Microtetraspora malaysiensis TaxID=161358 RepID=UPI003D9225CD